MDIWVWIVIAAIAAAAAYYFINRQKAPRSSSRNVC